MPNDQVLNPAQKAGRTKGLKGNRKAGKRAARTSQIRAEVAKAKKLLAAAQKSLEKIKKLTGAVR